MDERLKIKDIIQKLKNLDCPLLGSGEDAWITEILFKPNFDRYHLMEWIFSRLGFSIPKGDGCQNSSEVKVKNLLAAISALGLCGKNRSDVIQGLAPFKDQLNLWKLLVDIMGEKCSYSFSTSEAGSASNNNETRSIIDQQCDLQTKYINKLCESVHLKNLFKEKLELFPPYLLEESKEVLLLSKSKIESLKDIKMIASKDSNNAGETNIFRMDIFHESEGVSECNDTTNQTEEVLNKRENDICSSLIELKKHSSTDFNEFYKNLKLYLNVPADESSDFGPAFQTAKCELDNFLKLKNAMSTLKSSESELKTLNADLKDLEVPSGPMSDSLLREGISVLNDKNNRPASKTD